MSKFEDESNEEKAPAFIVCTCQLNPRSSLDHPDHMHDLIASTFPELAEYSIMCGSHAEFYIRPPITCIDDVDFLIAQIDELVFSGELPVLPTDISGLADTIQCLKIEPYDSYPGFVRLRLWGEINYDWNFTKYEINYSADPDSYAMLDMNSIAHAYAPVTTERIFLPSIVSGPAIKSLGDEHTDYFIGFDFVRCLW